MATAAGSPQPANSDRSDSRVPGAGIVYPNDDRAGLRPPGAVGVPPARCRNSSSPPSAPTAGRCNSPRCRRKSSRMLRRATAAEPAPPGSRLPDQGARGHHRRRYTQHLPLLRARRWPCDPLRRPRRPRWLHLDRRAEDQRKAEWPDWHPPTEMIERQPYLPRFMAGGPGNPLGARAMYLGSTIYRIHGTNQPSTIGKFVSSGCIGMLNEDVSDCSSAPRSAPAWWCCPAARRPAPRPPRPRRRPVALQAAPAQAQMSRPFPVGSRPWCRRCPPRSPFAKIRLIA